jgi:hypothetical protein
MTPIQLDYPGLLLFTPDPEAPGMLEAVLGDQVAGSHEHLLIKIISMDPTGQHQLAQALNARQVRLSLEAPHRIPEFETFAMGVNFRDEGLTADEVRELVADEAQRLVRSIERFISLGYTAVAEGKDAGMSFRGGLLLGQLDGQRRQLLELFLKA